MTRDEVLKRMLKKKPMQQKTMKPLPPKPTKPLDKILDKDRMPPADERRIKRS